MTLLDFSIVMVGWVIGARLAYGSWMWEWRKTWHGTKDEIAYLRAVNDNQSSEINRLTDELYRDRNWKTRQPTAAETPK